MNIEIKLEVIPLYGKQEYVEVDYGEFVKPREWSHEEIEVAHINKYADPPTIILQGQQ